MPKLHPKKLKFERGGGVFGGGGRGGSNVHVENHKKKKKSLESVKTGTGGSLLIRENLTALKKNLIRVYYPFLRNSIGLCNCYVLIGLSL